ncbi:MAG: YdcF family protein [Betaproteobacteria bacterium]|nr:YdcF family protein [Betaproteobacteria bacterium]
MFSWIGPFKPLISALLLPPASPLLLLLVGLAIWGVSKRWGRALCVLSTLILWVLSCSATAYGLNHWLLSTYPPISKEALNTAQAIVVLGGGVEVYAPEYGQTQLGAAAYQRLAYGRYLKTLHDLPLVYSGGKGWAASSAQTQSEAQVAAYVLKRDFDSFFFLADDTSRDTRENALASYAILSAKGIRRIALVTHDWHMQRSVTLFEAAGFEVFPAPMGYTQPPLRWETDFLPSAGGLLSTQRVLHEWLGRLHY